MTPSCGLGSKPARNIGAHRTSQHSGWGAFVPANPVIEACWLHV